MKDFFSFCPALVHPLRITMILAVFFASDLVRSAAAAAPSFQGTFTSASLCSPRGIGLSPSGEVYVGSDCTFPNMQRFTTSGGFLGTWGFPAGYQGPPNGVALDGSGNVYVTDSQANRVYKFTGTGVMVTSWGSTLQPVDVAVNGSGDVFVAGLGAGSCYPVCPSSAAVQRFASDGTLLGTIGSVGFGPGQFQQPRGIAVDASNRIYVADHDRWRILRFNASGSFDMEFSTPGPPYDVAVGTDGNLYVTRGYESNQVLQYSPGGTLLQSFSSPNGLDGGMWIAINPAGAIYIVEQGGFRITKFQIDQTTGATRKTFGRLKTMYR